MIDNLIIWTQLHRSAKQKIFLSGFPWLPAKLSYKTYAFWLVVCFIIAQQKYLLSIIFRLVDLLKQRTSHDWKKRLDLLHSLVDERVASGLADNKISPLHNDDAGEEGSVAGVLEHLALLVGLQKNNTGVNCQK